MTEMAGTDPSEKQTAAIRLRKLNGVETSVTHPGAVTLMTALGNKLTVTLRERDIERVGKLISRIIKEDE